MALAVPPTTPENVQNYRLGLVEADHRLREAQHNVLKDKTLSFSERQQKLLDARTAYARCVARLRSEFNIVGP